MSDKSERMATAIRAMEFLAIFYPGADLPAASIEARCVVLAGLEPELLEAAVQECCRRCKFMPTPAEIIEIAQEAEEAALPSAEDAWSWALDMASGDERPCPHPIAGKALWAIGGHGGWQVEDRKWHRKEFFAAYAVLMRRELAYATGSRLLDEPMPTPRISSGQMESVGGSLAGVLGAIERGMEESAESGVPDARE